MRKGTAFRKHKETRIKQKERVLEVIKAQGEVTTYRLYELLAMKPQSLTGRLSDLEQEGLIYQKGRFIPEAGKPCTI